MSFFNKINNILTSEKKINTELEFLLKNNPIYVVGKNDETLCISNIFDIKGILDDFSEDTNWMGIPIYKSNDISLDSLVINCSTSISPVSVKNNFTKMGFKNIINYCELFDYNSNIKKPKFSADTIKDFTKNSDKWVNLYNLLKDNVSKKVLEDVMLFRMSSNPEYMNKYTVRLKEQYMEKFMEYSNDIMVDAGSFDGETSEIFCDMYPDYKKIYIFEPSEINFCKVKDRLSKKDNIIYHKVGLSDSKQTLYFDGNSGSSSKISNDGNTKIDVIRLDDITNDKISFIKMDIEGSELDALKGSVNHIKNNHPKLAIAAYHNPEDFWKISEFILSIRNDYDIYIRHYTEGWSETILYFKPIYK